MDKSISCECGKDHFWFFGAFVRCSNCLNEFKYKPRLKELWMRRWNMEEKRYSKNWEKPSIKL